MAGAWRDLVSLRIGDGGSLDFSIGWIVYVGALLLLGLLTFMGRHGWKSWFADSVRVSFMQVDVTLKRTNEVVRVAHEAWAEIITRKAALPFEEDHDLIVDIYSSWYELFKELRALIRTIPAEQMQGRSKRAQSARDLVRLLEEVLNSGLRPHLTQFQSRFRPWYDHRTKEYDEVADGQTIQREYAGYEDLLISMREVNQMMVKFSRDLKRIAQGDSAPSNESGQNQ